MSTVSGDGCRGKTSAGDRLDNGGEEKTGEGGVGRSSERSNTIHLKGFVF